MYEYEKLDILRIVAGAHNPECGTIFEFTPKSAEDAALSELDISRCFKRTQWQNKSKVVFGLSDWGILMLTKLEEWEERNRNKSVE